MNMVQSSKCALTDITGSYAGYFCFILFILFKLKVVLKWRDI